MIDLAASAVPAIAHVMKWLCLGLMVIALLYVLSLAILIAYHDRRQVRETGEDSTFGLPGRNRAGGEPLTGSAVPHPNSDGQVIHFPQQQK